MKGKKSTLATVSKFVADKASYSDEAIETDSTKILECIKFIERVIHDAVVVLCGRDRVHYVSSNCRAIIGLSHKHFQSLTLEETIDMLHKEDVPGFRSCMEKLMLTTSRQHSRYKFLLYYRLKNESGDIVVVQDEKIAVETTPGKFVFITLLRNISTQEIFTGVKLTIQKMIKDRFITIDQFFPSASIRKLTPRETDIANLVVLGLSNKAIAQKLNLSLSTIKNHKQTLFRKINVKSSIELLKSIESLRLVHPGDD